jgi:hexosaminidase
MARPLFHPRRTRPRDRRVSTVSVAIIPRPLSVTGGQADSAGAVLSDGLVIAHAPELEREARWFRRGLEAGTGWAVSVAQVYEPGTGVIELRIGDLGDLPGGLRALLPAATGHEAYRLTSSGGRVVITSPSGTGVCYGLQTLRQLLPDSLLRQAGRSGPIQLAGLEIVDAPRLAWRGVHLDVSRHFMPKSFVLRLIDLIAFHKCNVLHLHLTDDQGWRIPIQRYPRLTEIGAWRSESEDGQTEGGRDGTPHGGFYTRADLDEIVAFAAERHVNVLPEIDMPGHMVAAIAAYPELGNTGQHLDVATCWGISSHVLNLEERTLRFCAEVIDEAAGIFPWRYFHLGGDECPVIEWQRAPRAQQIMRENSYAEERQLQGWFTARMAEHLLARGRTLVGWSEILEGGAPADSVVMAWRCEEDAVKAVAAGHDVVVAAQDWLYFDRPYSLNPAEPRGFPGATGIEKVYLYDPVPAAIPPGQRDHLLGAQCQLWTEYVATPDRAEYMYFPRLAAFAEAVWMTETVTQPKSYDEFVPRLARHLQRLAALGVNYRPLEGPTPAQARGWLQPPGAASTARNQE